MRGWPTIYFVDHKGVIRYMNRRGPAMDAAVELMLDEIED